MFKNNPGDKPGIVWFVVNFSPKQLLRTVAHSSGRAFISIKTKKHFLFKKPFEFYAENCAKMQRLAAFKEERLRSIYFKSQPLN